ncbi:MAG: hypothetical protein M3Z17_08375 [Gemmatimonadota bacterium]|nr:hypothetical protein [Gemmatimonadota bacterium]
MRSSKTRVTHVVARLFALAPFVLGFIRVAQTGNDTRVLWLAIASFIGATIAIIAIRSRDRTSHAAAVTSVFVGASAGIAAIVGGILVQRGFSVGATMFAIVFGISWGIGYALDASARQGQDPTAGVK